MEILKRQTTCEGDLILARVQTWPTYQFFWGIVVFLALIEPDSQPYARNHRAVLRWREVGEYNERGGYGPKSRRYRVLDHGEKMFDRVLELGWDAVYRERE